MVSEIIHNAQRSLSVVIFPFLPFSISFCVIGDLDCRDEGDLDYHAFNPPSTMMLCPVT
jgi:hypothetical protein